jgi:hypothetical protein
MFQSLFKKHTPEKIRKKNLKILSEANYQVAPNLPLHNSIENETLRPYVEIAKRVFALQTILFWVIQDNETTSNERILNSIKRNDLKSFMTKEEKSLFDLTREEANLRSGTIGWKFENLWALAWVLGFYKEPEFNMGYISDEIIKEIIYEFLPSFDYDIDYMDKYNKRTFIEVYQMEDLFYCAHNAARSAQLGNNTIPKGCDTIILSGAIHEKRHSLTWCLSPNTEWDDTDLST